VAPLTLAAAVDPGWWTAIYVALLFVSVEPLTGYVIEPMLYGHSTGLSPLAVVLAAVFWAWLWGPVGLILSTPLTLCLVVVGRHVESLQFFDVLLGDRPALSEVDRFYQRTLANDPDEALAQAETMLADRPLVDYYDGVVLPGLKLAAEDEARGTITRQRAAGITRSMLGVVHDLDGYAPPEHATAAPVDVRGTSPHPTGASVACVASQSPFDEVVSAMLGQLLAGRGVASRILPYSMVSRERVAQLNLSDAPIIIVSSLAPGVTPAHVRYLIRRLRQRTSTATIIAGLWSLDEAALNDPARQKFAPLIANSGQNPRVDFLWLEIQQLTESVSRPCESAHANVGRNLRFSAAEYADQGAAQMFCTARHSSSLSAGVPSLVCAAVSAVSARSCKPG